MKPTSLQAWPPQSSYEGKGLVRKQTSIYNGSRNYSSYLRGKIQYILKINEQSMITRQMKKIQQQEKKGQDKQTKMDKEKFKEENIWKKKL